MNACGVSPVSWTHLNLTSGRVCFATKCGLNAAFGILAYV